MSERYWKNLWMNVVELGMGSVKRLELDAMPREGGWDYIYLNGDIQGSKQ